jgi:BirA family transcriptional regulator, biotin operon repressor / biotin---[acetyl-CoA-carboxylase] ligase
MIQFSEIHFDSLPSTNSWLREAAQNGRTVEGSVVVAGHQSAGRGRMGRSWNSEPGTGLLFSFLLYPPLPVDILPLMSLFASLSVTAGLEDYLAGHGISNEGLSLRNDVLYKGRKLCGILCEGGVDESGRRFLITGVGINVNQVESDFPPRLRTPAISLYQITYKVEDPHSVLSKILPAIAEHYARLCAEGETWITKEWLAQSALEGRRIEVEEETGKVAGVVLGLTKEGALIIQDDAGGVRVIRSGDMGMTA